MGKKIECAVRYVELENDSGRTVAGVEVTCNQCGHQTESFGRTAKSVRRCLALMREECPEDQGAYYASEDPEDMEDGT